METENNIRLREFEIILTRQLYAAWIPINGGILGQLDDVKVRESTFDFITQMVTAVITTAVYSQDLEVVVIEAPTTWVQHLKKRFAPRWFKDRWPVQYVTVKAQMRAHYPGIMVPNQPHVLKVMRLRRDDGFYRGRLDE